MIPRFSRRDVSILIGNVLDHFDAGLYGFLAPVLAPLFFPDHDPIVQLILAYSILATTLVTRPLGAMLFGIVARRRGALWALSYSLLGAALATFAMGTLPTYETLGWIAPILLLILRGLGGVFAAGESTVAQLYIMDKKSFQAGMQAGQYYHTSSMAGMILSSLAATLAIVWGDEIAWRMCFFAGSLAGLLGVLLRYFAKKEPFKIRRASVTLYSLSSLKAVGSQWRLLLAIATVSGFSYMTYAVPCIFMNSFVPLISSHSLESMMELNTALLLIDLILIPTLGYLLLKQNILHVMITALVVLALTCPVLFYFLPESSLLYVSFVRLWVIFWGVVFLCPLSQWYNHLLKTPHAYILLGMGQALGTSTLGRLAPSAGFWIFERTASSAATALMVSACAFLVFLMLRKHRIKVKEAIVLQKF